TPAVRAVPERRARQVASPFVRHRVQRRVPRQWSHTGRGTLGVDGGRDVVGGRGRRGHHRGGQGQGGGDADSGEGPALQGRDHPDIVRHEGRRLLDGLVAPGGPIGHTTT